MGAAAEAGRCAVRGASAGLGEDASLSYKVGRIGTPEKRGGSGVGGGVVVSCALREENGKVCSSKTTLREM